MSSKETMYTWHLSLRVDRPVEVSYDMNRQRRVGVLCFLHIIIAANVEIISKLSSLMEYDDLLIIFPRC